MKTLNVEETEYNRLQKIKKASGVMLYRLIQQALVFLEEKYKQELEEYERDQQSNIN